MKSERFIKAIVGILIAIGIGYYTTTIQYDSDDVLSTSSYNDTVGPLLFIAFICIVYGGVHLYKFFTKQ
jgi:ABC-type antimicrobial peptide transport system permease subunit